MSFGEASRLIEEVVNSDRLGDAGIQHYRILGSSNEVLKALFGVGFLGIFDRDHNTFVFSHDGKKPERAIQALDVVMVHPCYWAGLSVTADALEGEDAEEIFDEYEVRVTSKATEKRKHFLGQLMAEMHTIPLGNEGAAHLEDWTKRAVEIAFARQLGNFQLKPNAGAAQRRDIVATNQGTVGFWRRIREDYGTRQVVFEAKNFERLGVDEFRQAYGYLGREYGKLAFIVCRDSQTGLTKGGDLEAFREFYAKDGSVIMKIPATFLCGILSKLRNPEKFDAGSAQMEKLLDTYVRLYAAGQTDRPGKHKKTY